MARVIHFDKGSKRRMRQIRWTPFEKASLAVLLALLCGFCVLVGLWDASSSVERLRERGEHILR